MTTEERMSKIEQDAVRGFFIYPDDGRSLTEDSDKKWYDAVQKAERILEGQ